MDVSIVIPVHDEGWLLRDTVRSVLTQRPVEAGLPAFEIVVVADRPAAPEMLQALEAVEADAAGCLRVLHNTRGPGPGGARNTGILAARGTWVAFLDGDDLWTDSALAERWAAIDTHIDAGWVGSDFEYWRDGQPLPAGALGALQGNTGTRALLAAAFDTGRPALYRRPAREFLQYILCWTGTVMARRELLLSVGLFDESLRRAQDVHLWYRLAAAADYLFVPRVHGFYRQRASTLQRRGHSIRGPHNRALRMLLDDPLLEPWQREIRVKLAATLIEEAGYLRGQRDFAGALQASLASLRLSPWRGLAWRHAAASLLRKA